MIKSVAWFVVKLSVSVKAFAAMLLVVSTEMLGPIPDHSTTLMNVAGLPVPLIFTVTVVIPPLLFWQYQISKSDFAVRLVWDLATACVQVPPPETLETVAPPVRDTVVPLAKHKVKRFPAVVEVTEMLMLAPLLHAAVAWFNGEMATYLLNYRKGSSRYRQNR